MNLDDAKPRKSNTELPIATRGEASGAGRSVEAKSAVHGTERSGTSGLMEAVLERRNLQAALKRVKQNKGSPGIDRDDGGGAVEPPPRALAAPS